MVWVGRDLKRLSSSNPLAQAGMPSTRPGCSKPHPTWPSQNHRIVGVGRDLWGSSSPAPLPKQGHLQQAAQDLVQAGLEYLQRRRLHNLTGQPVPVLPHLEHFQGGGIHNFCGQPVPVPHHPQSEEFLPYI